MKNGKVTVKLRNGDIIVMGEADHEDYIKVINEVCSFWHTWLHLGFDSVVRKSDIVSVYYKGPTYEG